LIQQWNKYFETLDIDHSGMIKIKEMIKVIEKTGKFKSQLAQLKQLNKKNPHLTIKYSDFLLRIVDIKKEIKPEDIANAFTQIDVDNSGKIDTKDLQNYLKRRGDGITEEEAQEMIQRAETKISLTSFDASQDKRKIRRKVKEEAVELDYPMFKKYLCNPSPESHGFGMISMESSLRFSEYKNKLG